MEREWHPFLRYGYTAMSTLFSLWKARFVQMMEYLKQNQVGNGGMVEPLVQCVEAMYAEMEAVMNGECIHLAELELRMRVFSIGNGNEEENVKVGQVLITRQPWAFLGLLGLSVAGAVRCRGKSEDDWREFWNRNRFEVRDV
ncbi:hypothetical protein BCR33DRAFT_781674 [Rhizoclosmatium globosum]|uniref:Uncharacterized protein n=1 Tax=Rhizoclosmatium globosum TaxID=329046 RepID=A0A1Y2CR24_9FUNG|nr:hypothetical protein BCR33DRAFT_781674 [Rhizoclosmatium globosum]|eukprot:ORY49396.1 hypothetical protein BCR33DRAFT_781674 [Rhizoclosmatium globosum]